MISSFLNIPNKFLVRFFVSYCLHKCRLVSVIHRINAAFGASKAFVPYRMDYNKLIDFATAKSVPTADFIEFATGYSNVTQTNIYRQGNHIFGRVICQKTSGNFSNEQQTIAAIKSAYRPTENQIGQSYYNSSSQWGVESIGYSYLSSEGSVIVKTCTDGNNKYNYCMFLVDFLIKT